MLRRLRHRATPAKHRRRARRRGGRGALTLLGCGQITWRGAPEPEVLREVREAGYDGAPPRLVPGRGAAATLDLYRRHELRPAPCYLSAPLWQRAHRGEIVDAARRAARFSRELGCRELYLAARGEYRAPSGRTRRQAAGQVRPGDGLAAAEMQVLADTVSAAGEATLAEGVRSCFHSHVGSVIETGDEIEALLERVDPGLVWLGPDTGHLAWAGVDPVAFCRRHIDRILTLHLKDIDETVRRRGRDANWDYEAFARGAIFVELGEGSVDFPGLLAPLRERGFDGWLIVETDVPRRRTALESAAVSRRHLRSLGL